MSFTYFKFLFVNTVKKKSIWITWLLFLFTCTAFLIILPIAAEMNTLQVWANTTMAICQTFMGMIAGLFTAVLAINIFKDTNEEGTELIVISKPISRMKLVMSKFALFGVYCLLINISAVALSAFTYFLPRTESKFYIGLLVSMFIGNLITFGIFGSISILLTVKFVKVGIIITNIMISLVFLIYQSLTLFVFPTPLKELDNQYMSTSTYIIHDRNSETGEYVEDEVVQFNPSVPENGQPHPCKATSWKEMVDYWKQDILSKDPTPVLNVTDLASQLALTYMSYQTDSYASRQANRMFAWTRFYNYDLTSPASPELFDDIIKDKKSLPWVYTGWNELHLIEDPEDPLYPIVTIVLPSQVGFDGIPPLTGTRLRGYGDTIPVGSIRSKENLFSTEVYFEKDLWLKYAKPFDLMYDLVYDYRNYIDLYDETDEILPSDYLSLFNIKQSAVRKYYVMVWSCLMGKTDTDEYRVFGDPEKLDEMKKYGPSYFNINNVLDLNERFVQFKNYVIWKAYKEQKEIFDGVYVPTQEEKDARSYIMNTAIWPDVIELTYFDINKYIFGVEIRDEGDWMMKALPDNEDKGLIVQNSIAPCLDFMQRTLNHEISVAPEEQKIPLALKSSYAIFKKTARIFKQTSDQDEDYLFDSLTKPNRQWKYSGRAYTVTTGWYPNINGFIKDVLETDVNIPVGQNMQLFYYNTSPKVKYWIFSVLWGTISLSLFAAGVIVYNKYDVK